MVWQSVVRENNNYRIRWGDMTIWQYQARISGGMVVRGVLGTPPHVTSEYFLKTHIERHWVSHDIQCTVDLQHGIAFLSLLSPP